MILKMYDAENDGWVILDDVYNVEVRQNCSTIKSEFQENRQIFQTTTKVQYYAEMVFLDVSKPEKDHLFTFICVHRTKNESRTYAFNTIGYLMNDNGKTLEIFNN